MINNRSTNLWNIALYAVLSWLPLAPTAMVRTSAPLMHVEQLKAIGSWRKKNGVVSRKMKSSWNVRRASHQ